MTDLAQDRLRLLDALRGGKVRRTGTDIPRVDRSGPLPVSFTQRRLYFLDRLVPDSPAYLIFQTALLGAELDVAALRAALNLLVHRHEALRTVFTPVDGEPMQIVRSAGDVADVLETGPAGDPGEVFPAWVRRPFDLAADAMLRALLMPAGDGWAFGLCVHHIAADAWSVALLLRELAAAYEAFAAGREPDLPPVPVAYPDVAAWQRARGTTGVKHWAAELAGAPDVLDLPFDRPRPAVQSFAGDRLVSGVPADLAAGLAEVGCAAEATRFMTMFAVFAVLLSRYTGQTDILVGVPVAGRSRVEFEDVVGFFANTIVLRADLYGDPSFTELLGRIRATALRAYANQELPFEVLVDRIAPRRDMSHNPLFQVKFALQNAPAAPFRLPGVRTEPLDVDNDTAKFDLSLDVTETGGDLELAFEYDTAIFDEGTVAAAARHYRALCEAVVLAPGTPVSGLPMLGPGERAEVLAAGSGPATAHPGRTVPELIADRAAETPDATAVWFGQATLTYRELDERANWFANHLRARGAGQETCVAVHLHRGTELMVALLGVLRSGAAYLPVDPGYPAERIAYLLGDARVPLVLTQPGLAVPRGDWDVLELGPDTPFDTLATAPPAPDPDSLAYVIYTSGSTGRPKGAMVHHRALTNRLAWMGDRYGVCAADRIAQKTPYSFDVSVWELFLPLVRGATLVVAEPGAHQDSARLAELFHATGVTITHFVPPMLGAFLDQPDRPDLPALRLVVCSGQALPKDLAERAVRELGAACENLYGPTEATIDVSAYTPASSPYEARCAVAPIGRPIDNVALRVLGPWLDPRPAGVPGELYLGGVGVGRGYRDRPGLTAERYLPDPFGPPGAVLYRTGDRARLLPDGNVEFLGRLDGQLKIRGFRVEPGEIESVLRAHPGVRDAVVVPAPDTEAIVGYVVPAADSTSAEPGRWSGRVLGHWTGVWNAVYDTEPGSGPDYSGWRSSRTGEDYGTEEMAEWVATTVDSVLALRPRRVLELGCGSGLLFRELRGHVEHYVGTDLSHVVVDRLTAATAGDDAVDFHCQPANTIDFAGEFDVVILNSVIQYFPDAGYLTEVLDRAMRACRPDGVVFVGDVRDLALREAAALWALTGKRPDADPARLADWVTAELGRDNELAVATAYFTGLAARHGRVADLRLKTGSQPTEMNLFRYDVCLRPAVAGLVRPADLPRIPWPGTVARDLPAAPAVLADIPYPAVVRLLNALRGTETEVAGRTPAELVAAAGPGAHCVPALDNPGHYHAVLTGDPHAAIATEDPETPAVTPLTTVPTAREQDRELVSTLREYLRDRLPEYLVPAGLTTLAELPLTPNGKVDHRALPAFAPAGPATTDGYEAPRPGVEQTLATIVEDLLGVARVGRHDDFFAVGGESIVALLLVSRARLTGIQLTPAAIFQHPTVAAMATVAGEIGSQDEPAVPAREAVPANPRPWAPGAEVTAAYPLAPMQHEMLSAALERAEPGLHVATVMLRIGAADFDERAFVASWQYLMERHAVFRSSCTWHGLPGPVQTAWWVPSAPVTRVDLRGHDPAEQERLIRAALLAERLLVQDPHTAPQWRITLFATTGGYRALLRFTYLFQDGWSFENVQRELFATYDALRHGRQPDLPPLPAFATHIDWLARRDATERDADAAYWTAAMRRHRGRTPVLETLGTPRQLGPGEFPYVAEGFTFDPAVEAKLRESVRRQGSTLFTLLQGAWAVLLAAVTGREDVTFGVVTAGRPEQLPRVTELVGPFNNMLTVPVGVPDGADRGAWLRELQREQAEMRQHQYTALAQIREWAGLPWREPLYDSYLVFENFPMDEAIGKRMAAWEPEDGITQTEHPLRVMVWPAGGLALEISYYARLFDAATIRWLLDGYQHLVVALAADDDTTLADLKKLIADRRGEHR